MRAFIFKFFVFLIALAWQLFFAGNALADSRCGEGFVCWDNFGGQQVVVVNCTVKGTGQGYCASQTPLANQTCNCTGSPTCHCSLQHKYCSEGQVTGGIEYVCRNDQGQFTGYCNAQGQCPGGEEYGLGTCHEVDTRSCDVPFSTIQSGCCFAETSPTPTPTPSGPGDPTPTPSVTPTPTPPSGGYFSGYVFVDPNATATGIGGSDNICTGSENTPANDIGGTISVTRSGENKAQVLNNAAYNITTSTTNSDYTITLDLPINPQNPSLSPYQCACNSTPGNPYRCQYTSQTPPSGASDVNFFVKPTGVAGGSWFQTFGGNFFARSNISTDIPVNTPKVALGAVVG